MLRTLHVVALLAIGLAPVLAEGDDAPSRRAGDLDRGARVIRTPDTASVPADLHPRQRRDIEITVDPYARRRDDVIRTPSPRRPDR